MVNNMRDNDTEGEVKMFQWAKGFSYTFAKSGQVFDWQILGPLEVSTSTAKGCSLKKNVNTQMNKIFDNHSK